MRASCSRRPRLRQGARLLPGDRRDVAAGRHRGDGYFDDTFVRTADGWRIKPRSLGAPWPSGRGRTPVPGGDWLADACG